MIKIGWFSSGRGEGSRGLLRFIQNRIESGNLEAKIEFVFSNRSRGEFAGSDQFFDMISQMENFKKSFISSIIVLFGFIILLKICNPIFHYL